MKKILLPLCLLVMSGLGYSQTPGVIVKSAGTGATVLDPDGDGYVSQKTSSTQIGFTIPPNSDVSQSEIPYVPIVTVDPINDLEQGRSCSFSELVGSNSPDQYAALTFWDNAHSALLFRIRIASYVANSKAYSVLIDTDQKFGYTGANADPNALPGNPGFEIELALMTNFGVGIYNVNGTTSPVLVTQKSYDNFVQKSIAVSTFCGDADYFFDFYVPITDLASFGINQNSPLRFAILTNMNPDPCIGSNSLSDVGGSSSANTIDGKLIDIITSQTPTPPTGINTGIVSRSVCPPINTVYASSTSITGTTTEADGTLIKVFLYAADGTTLLGNGNCTASGGGWSFNVSSFSPAVTLATGQRVKATATATGKGESNNDCDIEIVGTCPNQTTTPLDSEIDIYLSDKGYVVNVNRPIGTKIYLYNSDGTLFDVSILKVGSTNPITTTAQPQSVLFECQTGMCFSRALGSSVYRFKFEEPGSCQSYGYLSCDYTTGVSSVPTINVSTATTSTSSISGNGTSGNAEIVIYINDIPVQSVTTAATSPFAFTANFINLELGDKIVFKQIETGKCYSAPVTIYVTRPALAPVVVGPSCNASYPISSIIGTSVEAAGTTITVYKLNPTRTSLGTTTVQANGTWTKTGLNLNSGDQLTAAVSSGTNLLASADAPTVTLSTQTNIANYSIAINTAIEGQTSVSGTITAGSYPVTLNLIADGSAIGSTTVNVAGNWTVSGLHNFDLATGSILSVKLTATGLCESTASSTERTVTCTNPNAITISSSTQAFCDGAYGQIVVHNSQTNVLYTPVLASNGSVFGFSKMGNGGDLTLTTNQISDSVYASVKASKLPVGTCEITVASNILIAPLARPSTPIANPTQYFCATGTLSELVINLPASSSVRWYTAYTGGTELATTTNLANGVTYYAEAICDTTSCSSLNRIGITAQNGNPPAPIAAAAQTKCWQSTLSDINASTGNPGSLVWYSSPSGGTALPTNTALVTGTTYYVETVHNACHSATRTAVTVTLGYVPDTTRWTGLGANSNWDNEDNWNTKPPTVCSHVIIPDLGNGVRYPVISSAAACKSITFEPGGAVLGLQHLSYEQAFVQMQLQRMKWYTLTAPLKSMFSGDYYMTGQPKTQTKLFDDVNPDIIGDTVAVGTWTRSFANLTVPFTAGMGFAFQIDTLSYNYPHGTTSQSGNKTIYFPRRNTNGSLIRSLYPYSGVTGKVYTNMGISLPKDSLKAYRFAMENESNQLVDVRVPIKAGLNLVGNPLMTHLDFNLLYASNGDKISNNVKFWNGTTFTTYMAGDNIASTMDLAYTKIPPMQAFFVYGLESADTQLDINLNEHFVADTITKLRSAKVITRKNLMHIKARLNGLESWTAIAQKQAAQNGFEKSDAFKLFSSNKAVPEIYTMAENNALDINQFGSLPYMTPIGLKANATGIAMLEFYNPESFEGIDVTLLNTRTGEQQNLKANNRYTVFNDGSNTDGSLFIEFRSANTTTELAEQNSCVGKCVQVYYQDGTLFAISPKSDKIKKIVVWEELGTQLYNSSKIETSNFELKLNTTSQICVCRVETVSRVYVVKVMMK